ncbi:MAG: hypothetical protein LBK61_14610 [Spirochaetaceae bacterium]|jgi:hypothetical protein|nr:hypothetical protein [Spirochaetaceae bacterium]
MYLFFSVLWTGIYVFGGFWGLQNEIVPLFWIIVFYPVSMIGSLIGFKIGSAVQNFFYNEMNVLFLLSKCPALVGFAAGASLPPLLFLIGTGRI